ncbi:S-methyl-5-thioribose-1-phosphate isomerase [Powellomyces hirtus]|uniref:Translation initiation factor eIF2B subunit beta n=1 Tax=Powellomyces hirtus TaxID=109895 RepID=A0A507E0J7_9FUNG|nr:S-methyl-5-thioribose-1-phosphate isomerase [Powellomyces hirtus]
MLKDIELQVDDLIAKLRRRQTVGSYNVAIATSRLLLKVVSASGCNDVRQLSAEVNHVGSLLQAAQPIELGVGNMVKRVLHLIREEHLIYTKSRASESSDTEADAVKDFRRNFVADVKQSIEEMIDELENTNANISNQAWEHIHSKEIILTVGNSATVATFLKEAARVREFQVIVAETSPSYSGHEMAVKLAEMKIDTTVITDSAIFAVMSRVNKVILGAHAVTANGGVVATCGSKVVAAAAKEYSTPVVVCTGMHKLSPSYPYDTDIFNLCVSPDPVISFEEGDVIDTVDIVNPQFDYIGPEDISLFITNIGTHPPSFVQRLIHDSYVVEAA